MIPLVATYAVDPRGCFPSALRFSHHSSVSSFASGDDLRVRGEGREVSFFWFWFSGSRSLATSGESVVADSGDSESPFVVTLARMTV